MTEKEILLELLNKLDAWPDRRCSLTGKECKVCPFAEDTLCLLYATKNKEEKYKRIINYYIKKYDKEDLLEVLILK